MGYTLSLETDQGRECPAGFTHSDSKALAGHLAWGYAFAGPDEEGALARLEARLGVSFAELSFIGSTDEMVEEMLASGAPREEYDKEVERNRGTWRKVPDFIQALEAIVAALRATPGVFAELAAEDPLDDEDGDAYFVDGVFLADLEDLLVMARWARDTGAERVRIVMA